MLTQVSISREGEHIYSFSAIFVIDRTTTVFRACQRGVTNCTLQEKGIKLSIEYVSKHGRNGGRGVNCETQHLSHLPTSLVAHVALRQVYCSVQYFFDCLEKDTAGVDTIRPHVTTS